MGTGRASTRSLRNFSSITASTKEGALIRVAGDDVYEEGGTHPVGEPHWIPNLRLGY